MGECPPKGAFALEQNINKFVAEHLCCSGFVHFQSVCYASLSNLFCFQHIAEWICTVEAYWCVVFVIKVDPTIGLSIHVALSMYDYHHVMAHM